MGDCHLKIPCLEAVSEGTPGMMIDSDENSCFFLLNEINVELKVNKECIQEQTASFAIKINFYESFDCIKLQNSVLQSYMPGRNIATDECRFYKECKSINSDMNNICKFECYNDISNCRSFVSLLILMRDILSQSEPAKLCEITIE